MVIRSEIFSADTMEIRKLGNSGLEVSGTGLGTRIHRLQENLKAEKKSRLLQKICALLPRAHAGRCKR